MSSEPPASAADAARSALRRLAHATRTIPEPGETYAMLGPLHAGMASLGQTLEQLADWHQRHAPVANTADPRQLGREVAAELAAAELRDAASFLEAAFGRVAAAWSHNGRVVWQPVPLPAPPERSQQLAGPSTSGTPDTPKDDSCGLGR